MSELSGLSWRFVGPYRGGRAMAVAGHPAARGVFYFGSSSGGVWKTDNGGSTWRNVSDGFFRRASVGAIAIADAHPNVIYVGMGECGLRSNVTHGDGAYCSTDGGATWTWLNGDRNFLVRAWYFGHILADPRDPDTVFVVNRKLWRSTDGGRSFRQVCVPYVDEQGLCPLSPDHRHPPWGHAAPLGALAARRAGGGGA